MKEQSALEDLERNAKRIRDEHAVPKHKARELAAREAGFGSYHAAREALTAQHAAAGREENEQ